MPATCAPADQATAARAFATKFVAPPMTYIAGEVGVGGGRVRVGRGGREGVGGGGREAGEGGGGGIIRAQNGRG